MQWLALAHSGRGAIVRGTPTLPVQKTRSKKLILSRKGRDERLERPGQRRSGGRRCLKLNLEFPDVPAAAPDADPSALGVRDRVRKKIRQSQ